MTDANAVAGPEHLEAGSGNIDSRVFAAARRHSRWVRLLKIVLPAVAVVMAAGFAAWSYVASPSGISIDMSGTALRDGKLVMANPKLDGFTSNDLPYTMSAVRAIQDVTGGGPVELEEIVARVPISDTNLADIVAPSGRYFNEENRLDITSDLSVKTTEGLEAQLKSASIDLAKGDLTTSDPVDIRTGGSIIKADSMSVFDGGKRLVFERRVRVEILPDTPKTTDADPRSTNASN